MNLETELNSNLSVKSDINAHQIQRNSVYAEIQPINNLKPYEHERLYHIFSKYYDGHSKEQFLGDLFEKNHIILLRDKKDRTLQGFSTLLKVELKTNSQSVVGIFSGDTILEKAYWGNSALGKAFLKYLWLEKIKNPSRPLYWFLISKGYKTYLLMANNFTHHYPRYEEKIPQNIKEILKEFYLKKYPNEFCPEKLWIKPLQEGCRLKESVAEITNAERKNSRIAFFEAANPRWQEGYELACIAEMTLLMPIKYSLKKFVKLLIHTFTKG